MKQSPTIIISRTDRIGDVVLTLPLSFILKQQFPGSRIVFLGRDYTQSIIEACPTVDHFLSWDAIQKLALNRQKEVFWQQKADVIIHVFPNRRIARLAKIAGIQERIGSSRRWFHWLSCNKRVYLKRRGQGLHEAVLNARLLSPLCDTSKFGKKVLSEFPVIKNQRRPGAKVKALLRGNKFNLVIHPFSKGSARDWPTRHFVDLIKSLPEDKFHIVVTGSTEESQKIKKKIKPLCKGFTDASGKINLNELIDLLATADGLVVGSTGPLHIAAAMGQRTLGLFPGQKGLSPDRWGPLGPRAKSLAAHRNCSRPCRFEHCLCMEEITVDEVREQVLRWEADHQQNPVSQLESAT